MKNIFKNLLSRKTMPTNKSSLNQKQQEFLKGWYDQNSQANSVMNGGTLTGITTTTGTGTSIWNQPAAYPGNGITIVRGTGNSTITWPPVQAPIPMATPFGANLIAMGFLKTIIAVRTYAEIAEDVRIQDQDIILCLDTMKMYESCGGAAGILRAGILREIRLDANLQIVYVQPEVVVEPERKEIFEVFEKTLDKISESKKDDRTILQKATDLFRPPSELSTSFGH